MRHRILHISDVHVGPPFRPEIAQKLIVQAHEMRPDLLVISGDFVQRADFADQWRAAKELCAALPTPQLVVPGNHDVPLFHVHLRLLNSLGRYRRYISRDLNPVFELPGLVVVGACTAHGLTVDGGRLSRRQASTLRTILSRYGPDTCKVVVWHHPLVNPPGITKDRTMHDADAAINLLDECDVEMLLCGHVHVSYVGNTLDVARDLRQGTIICQSGTTTSRRGHGREHGKNSCNLIEIEDRAIRISHLLYQDQVGQFIPVAEYAFPRRSSGAYELPRSEREIKVEG
ncbi:MAG: metallophosphoesterase [Oscillochloris sp.]|nr:metallophosphoesterase [Oscillochloris sp.]